MTSTSSADDLFKGDPFGPSSVGGVSQRSLGDLPTSSSGSTTDPFSGQDPFSLDPFGSTQKTGGQVGVAHTCTHSVTCRRIQTHTHTHTHTHSTTHTHTHTCTHTFHHTHTHTQSPGWGSSSPFPIDPFASQGGSSDLSLDPFASSDPFGDDPFSNNTEDKTTTDGAGASNPFQTKGGQNEEKKKEIKVPDSLPVVS